MEQFNKKELQLLLSILKESKQYRPNMRCNDAYDKEANLFSQEKKTK